MPADDAQADLFGGALGQDKPGGRAKRAPRTEPSASEQEMSFEEAFAELEKAVQALEQGGLPLKEALVIFEQGMQYARVCTQRLNAAELKISELTARLEKEESA